MQLKFPWIELVYNTTWELNIYIMENNMEWEKLMLSDENNKQHIREAIVAMERNNQSNYWEALGKVECPDM